MESGTESSGDYEGTQADTSTEWRQHAAGTSPNAANPKSEDIFSLHDSATLKNKHCGMDDDCTNLYSKQSET